MSRPTDKGFVGVVAVAILGCAVVLAIAFQISHGLATDRELRGAGGGKPATAAEKPPGFVAEPAPPEIAAREDDSRDPSGPPEDTASEAAGEGSVAAAAAGTDSASLAPPSPDERSTPPPREVTPAAAKEINPAEGHTVSLQPADEIGEASRKGAPPQADLAAAMGANARDRKASNSLGMAAAKVRTEQTAEPAPPSIEMIRGNRRSTEQIAATENEN